jgi:hypothetical protein
MTKTAQIRPLLGALVRGMLIDGTPSQRSRKSTEKNRLKLDRSNAMDPTYGKVDFR